jgi:hypothetical protein
MPRATKTTEPEPEPSGLDEFVDPDTVEDDLEEVEIPLSETARYEVQLGSTFTYRGLSHWPRVALSDSMMAFPNDAGEYEAEGQESLVYRVEQTAHARLDAIVARMKRDIDERYDNDQAVRRAAAAQAEPSAQEPGEQA